MLSIPKAILIKIQHNSSHILKGQYVSHENNERKQGGQKVLNNERTARDITIKKIKLYYRAVVIKTGTGWC